jgi:hypothetical protein
LGEGEIGWDEIGIRKAGNEEGGFGEEGLTLRREDAKTRRKRGRSDESLNV